MLQLLVFFMSLAMSAGLRSVSLHRFQRQSSKIHAFTTDPSSAVTLTLNTEVINMAKVTDSQFETLLDTLKQDPKLAYSVDEQRQNLLHIVAQRPSAPLKYALKLFDQNKILSLVNEPNVHGETPFHTACQSGKSVLALALLEMGALPSTKDNRGRNALHYAAGGIGNYKFDEQQIFLLILLGSYDVNEQDEDGNTPLHLACQSGIYNYQLKSFFKFGATLKIKNNDGQTVLHCLAKSNTPNARMKEIFRTTNEEYCLSRDIVLHRDNLGHTALFYAGQNNKEDMTLALLKEYSGSHVSFLFQNNMLALILFLFE